jgi:hypothetical protein
MWILVRNAEASNLGASHISISFKKIVAVVLSGGYAA